MKNIIFRVMNKFKREIYYLCVFWQFKSFGKNSIIQKPLFILNKKGIRIGNNVCIRPLARIECIPSVNTSAEIVIEDNCCIEQGLHLIAANKVHIHKDVLIAPYCYITDCMHDYEDVSLPVIKQGLKINETEIGEATWLGIGVKVFAGVHIGKHCVIGANSVVTRNIPDYSVAVGCPAKVIKKYDFNKKEWTLVKQMEEN